MQIIQPLGVILKQTDEPMILTDEEIQMAIKRAIIQKKEEARNNILRHGNYSDWLKVEKKTNFEILIDQDAVIKKANAGKHRMNWQKECEERRYEEKQQRILEYKKRLEKYDANYFLDLLKKNSLEKFGKEFIINEKNGHFVSAVIYFVSRDARFETELGYSFKKGLLLRGKSGIGKTYIIECIQENERIPIHINSLITITKILKSKGEFDISKGVLNLLDDVGTEVKKVVHFGTEIYWFKNFIEERYLETKDYSDLIISSNNNFSEMEEMYGYRARRRIEDEMFNVVNVVDFR